MNRVHPGRSFLPVVSFLVLSGIAAAQTPVQPGPVPVYDPVFEPGALTLGPGIGPAHPIQADMYRLWDALPGVYEATLPTGTLKIAMRKTSSLALFVEITGRFDGEDFFQRGQLSVGGAGWGRGSRLYLAYSPERLGERLDRGRSFGDNICSLKGQRTALGFQFETEFSDCSFPFHHPLSKWTIDTRAGEIRITEKGSETVTRLVRRTLP